MTGKRRNNFFAIIALIFAFVLTSAILSFSVSNPLNSNAYTAGSAPASIGSLTLSDYATRTDGQVFNTSVLNALYGKITGKTTDTYANAFSKVKGSTSSISGHSTTNATNRQNNSMNFSQINSGNAITVEFGGYKWNVVYLTTNTNSGTYGNSGDLIATLWMSENNGTSAWSGFPSSYTTAAVGSSDRYSPFNYGSSLMRVRTLNNGNTGNVSTSYATNTSTTTSVTAASRISNQYAKFTMTNAALAGNSSKRNTSLIEYLATPSQVNYQKDESWVWSFSRNGNSGWSAYLFPNEAWGTPSTSLINSDSRTGGWYAASNINRVTSQSTYYSWKDDYLWLPSMTETGYYNDGSSSEYGTDRSKGTSLWGIPDGRQSIRNSSGVSLLRSGNHSIAYNVASLTATGGFFPATSQNAQYVRPALHLNLTAAQKNLEVEFNASKVEREYSGSAQALSGATESWYTTSFRNAVDVKYFVKGARDVEVTPIAIGNYEVEFTLKDGRSWADGTTGAKYIDFDIVKRRLAFPQFVKNKGEYKGGGAVNFTLQSYNSSLISITVPSEYGGVTFNNPVVTATDVGKYTLNVAILDTANYEWATSNNSLTFEVTPAPVYVTLDDGNGQHTISGAQGSTVDVYLEIDQTKNALIHSGKTVTANIMAQMIGESVLPIKIGSVDITDQTVREKVTLDLSMLTGGSRYNLIAVSDDSAENDSGNYNLINETNMTLNVMDESFTTKLTWRLTVDGIVVPNQRTDAEISDLIIAFTGDTIVYDGKLYSFNVSAPTGYEIDIAYGIKTTPTALSGSNPNIGRFADSYTTEVRLRNTSNNSTQIYKITWEIKKAKFDLSSVRWAYDGDLPFTPGGSTAELDAATLPQGLGVTYGGSRTGNKVGQTGTATVEFTLSGDYLINYELPIASDTSSYDFTPGGSLTDFEWSKKWTVVAAVIPVAWKVGVLQDKNGKDFNARILASDAYNEIIEYLFYETDSNGNILPDAKPLTLAEIEILDSVVKYYRTKVQIKSNYADSYVLSSEELSEYFEVGEYSEAVEITLENLLLVFNGKAQAVVIKVITGAIGTSSFNIVYYDRDGVTPLSEIPTNVGEYRVEITLKAGVKAYLTGDNVIEKDGVLTAIIDYSITELIIDNSEEKWINTQKPPFLQVSFAEIQGLLYEYADMDGNILAFKDLKPGNTYKVRALIKDRNNYKFKNDYEGSFFETEWKEFNVSENEQLYDPLDPNNPFYPEDPDNPKPTPPENPGDGGSFIDKIKDFFEKLIESHFPLWQVATSAVALLLTLIFMIKAIQYGNRKKKAKGEAKKYNAKTYAALLPIFSTQTVWLNLSNMVWSIIAFSLCGVTVLMFLIALLTRRGWKKAELAKETAIEESEQRKLTAEKQEREAEKQERREFQERIVQGGQLGGDSSMFEEMRREMEERHREEMAALREEQSKRDEAMKIMLANLMGRQQADGDIPYAAINDTDLLVQKVIAGLLPAVQQMLPEATAYLAAPSEQNDELIALVEEQKALVEEQRAIVEEQSQEMRAMAEEHNEEMRAMNEKMFDLQEQLAAMSQERVEGVLLPDQSEEIRVLTERISELQEQLSQDRVEGIILPDQSEEMRAMAEAHNLEMRAMTEKLEELQQQLINMSQNSAETVVIPEQSEDIKALTVKMEEMQKLLLSQNNNVLNVAADRDEDDDTDDEEEEWDSILDEDDDDFVEAVIIEEDGTVKKTYPNFRMRLKQSSDKNREWYAAVKNLFCSQKGVTYRVYKRVEKIRYQGQVIAVIGIAKRSIKLWLALKPYEYDARRYHHKDVSDKPRFVDVPMYVRVSSDRALTRAQELILALFQELNMEARKRYNDRSIQELIFTLKHNKLLTNKQNKGLLCEVMHVHDCDVLSDELAEKCIESKNVDSIDESYIETLKLDDIDAKFQDGNRVTLEKLKKVGLVSEECTGYTVTAGHRLTKPMIIVANDFTLPAVKMITLTGGRAIKLTKI